MRRREFLYSGAIAAGTALSDLVTGATGAQRADSARQDTATLARKLPRWRGFNLMEKISAESIRRSHADPLPGNQPFRQQDFEWMAKWGFDFVRLPMDYHCWVDPEDPSRPSEKALRDIDQAVEWGRQYGVHVSLNQHHAPGYRVGSQGKDLKRNLWTDAEPQAEFYGYWSMFAERYRGIPSERLSFDLLNEPAQITSETYANVAKRAIAAIRRADPDRLIISDGLQWGQKPVYELVDQKVAQSTRGYNPRELTHYNAPWLERKDWPEPSWPMTKKGQVLDRDWLDRTCIQPWKKLEARGVGVHVGEWGVLDTVPHEIALRWMRDVLSLWKEAGWGWALWNFRGEHGYGFLDTCRKDVRYENFHGHRLDRTMLELLLEV